MTAVLIDEHVHEKVLKRCTLSITQEKLGVEQTLFIGQRVMHHSKKMTDL
jgi:hypothetical protein